MRNIINQIEKNRNNRKKALIVFIVLSFLVEIFTISFLIRPAYSVVNKADCGVVEHIHTSECYLEHKNYGESVLVCSSGSSSEMLSHTHDDFCYNENGKSICPLLEYQHVHTDDCYDENGVQICGAAYHQHGEECFRILGENESAWVLECGKAAHVHVESCYPELSAAPLEEMQVDFEETQSIEPDFEEVEIIEPEMELYEPVINNEIALFNDEQTVNTDTVSGHKLSGNEITSVKLEYKDENGTWIGVTEEMENVPANTTMRIEVGYNVDKSVIVNNSNTIVYEGIPGWMNPNSSAAIYDGDGAKAATLSVQNGNAVINFEQSYLDKFNTQTSDVVTIEGTFFVEGDVKWREIENPFGGVTLPGLTVNFKFEDNLSAKYGDFKVEKHNAKELIEVRDDDGKNHTYLKYELKVTSRESNISIPEICITDVLSTDNRVKLSDVIAGNGYVGVTATKTPLVSSETGFNPYETGNKVTNNTHGTVVLDNKNLKWEISNLQPEEVRTLVYYVELNERYVGSGSAGTLCNEATPESGGIKREPARDDFTPKADVDISKTQGTIKVYPSGSGTIDYTVTVSANRNNSYTITNANIKDAFGSGMGKYVVANQAVRVTITKGNTTETQTVTINSNGFDVPIDELKPGESVTITYSLQVQQIYSHTNGDASFENRASFVGHNKSGKWSNGYTFKGTGVTTTIKHNQWMRKMNGQTVSTATDISFGSNDAVYNYGNNIPQNGITGFTVPQNAQEYTVIVNEDGTWDMSGAQFNDQFNDDRIAYTGYLRIDEFDQVSSIGVANDLEYNDVLSILNGQNPTKTVWVDINGKNGFNITPTSYGLTDENKVYRLTYYAAVDPTETNIKNIVVSNGFAITGTIGYGEYEIIFGNFQTAVSSTLVGSASYDFDKESLFHEKKVFSPNGEIYWVIRANGTLPKGLHIQDRPSGNSMRSDSLVGVYMGDKDYDFSKITSFEELNAALSKMDEQLKEGTNKYFYNLQEITDLSQLNGHDFAIFAKKSNANDGGSGYMMKGIESKNGYKGIKGVHLDNSPSIAFGTDVMTTAIVQTWWFDLVPNETDKFYIYYKDQSDNRHYLHINAQDDVSISDTPSELTVRHDAGRIIIKNSQGTALNWYGGSANSKECFSAWGDGTGENNKLYLGTLDNNPRYNYKPQTITNVNDLNGKQFAIVTPGTHNSGLLVGGASDKKADALTGEWYTEKFSNDPPTVTRKSALQKWTFQKTGGAADEFYVYYTENDQQYFLELGDDSATTTVTPTTVKISCKDGKIHLKSPDGNKALDWNGGGQGAQTSKPYYSTWNNTENSNNQLHYVVTEEIISADSSQSSFYYSWSAHDNNGSIRINKTIAIDQNKSMYIVLRSHPGEKLEGYFSKTFDNSVGIMDDASDQFNLLDNATYTYHPNFPLRKEGMAAVYYNAEETDVDKQWTIYSVNKKTARMDDKDVWKEGYWEGLFKKEREFVRAKGSGLYVEWLMNVNWDGTIKTIEDEYVILTDHLDHKMEPVSLRLFYLGGTSTKNPPEYKEIPELDNNPDWEKIATNTKDQYYQIPLYYYNSKTGELKVAVSNLCKADKENDSVVNLQLICRVTDPDVIFSGTNSTLKNTADLTKPDGTFIGEHSDTHEIMPTYSIKKAVDVEKDEYGNYVGHSNKLTYTIEINPLAEDLIVGSDTLPVLIDEMSSNMELIGDIEVIKKVGDVETKLSNIKYSTIDNTTNKQIIFDNLPDKTHLIITYKTKVNVKQNQLANISNTAYWKGYKQPLEPQQSGEFSYSLGGTLSAIVKTFPKVVINKRDFYNSSITLSGAQFEIREVNENGNVGDLLFTTATTGNDGKITINSSQLQYDKVYQLKEIKAPTEYVLDDTPKYFIVVKNNDNPSFINNNGQMTIGGELVDVIIDYAVQDDTDLELTIYNKKARVTVNKVFHDESGNEIASEDIRFYGTYRFGLYYNDPVNNPNEKTVQILSITYSDTGKTLYALDGKETDEPVFTKARAGNMNFIYELNEKNERINSGNNAYLNGYSFDVTYSANSVFTPQKIDLTGNPQVTVTNKYHPIYMPSAGGMGLKNYYKITFFALMILTTLTAIVFRVRRKCK